MDAGAEIDLTHINRHHPLGIDRQESIHLVEGDGFAGGRTCADASNGGEKEKATTRALVPLRRSRREGSMGMFMFLSSRTLRDGCAPDRAQDGGMSSAATKIGTHMAADFLFGGLWFCVEQSLRRITMPEMQ